MAHTKKAPNESHLMSHIKIHIDGWFYYIIKVRVGPKLKTLKRNIGFILGIDCFFCHFSASQLHNVHARRHKKIVCESFDSLRIPNLLLALNQKCVRVAIQTNAICIRIPKKHYTKFGDDVKLASEFEIYFNERFGFFSALDFPSIFFSIRGTPKIPMKTQHPFWRHLLQ